MKFGIEVYFSTSETKFVTKKLEILHIVFVLQITFDLVSHKSQLAEFI